jgi:hypothetical protein
MTPVALSPGGAGSRWGLALSALSVPAVALAEKAFKHFVYGGEEGFMAILLLTAPLSIGVALIVLLWRWLGRDQPGPAVLGSGLILAATTWLGKALSVGLAADPDAGRMTGFSNLLASEFARGTWTKALGYLIAYFQFYGARLFILATLAGLFVGWNALHTLHRMAEE